MSSHYLQQQQQISKKQFFSSQLEQQLGLVEVQAPILAKENGIQDNSKGTGVLYRQENNSATI